MLLSRGNDDVDCSFACRSCFPVLVWHRLNWSSLFPLVHLDNIAELTQLAGGYVAGFTDFSIAMRFFETDAPIS